VATLRGARVDVPKVGRSDPMLVGNDTLSVCLYLKMDLRE